MTDANDLAELNQGLGADTQRFKQPLSEGSQISGKKSSRDQSANKCIWLPWTVMITTCIIMT